MDTSVVLKSMVDQARMVVLKAVASATDSPAPATKAEDRLKNSVSPPLPLDESMPDARAPAPINDSARLQKARSSALRLNSGLHGRTLTSSSSNVATSELGMRKVRSVRWDGPPTPTSALAPTPNPDRLSTMQESAANKLKSFKSFGRPHGGEFGSGPRNATFGEYGRPASAGLWGRDGRLAAHPMPWQVPAVDTVTGNVVGGSADMNATFDNMLQGRVSSSRTQSSASLSSPFFNRDDNRGAADSSRRSAAGSSGRSAAAMAGAALLGRIPSSSSVNNGGSTPPRQSFSLPRTATAMENSLMKKWSS